MGKINANYKLYKIKNVAESGDKNTHTIIERKMPLMKVDNISGLTFSIGSFFITNFNLVFPSVE